MASLISFLRSDEPKRNVLLGISEPKFNNATLNEDQTIQIKERMKAQRKFIWFRVLRELAKPQPYLRVILKINISTLINGC
jgi:hypothetical protein